MGDGQFAYFVSGQCALEWAIGSNDLCWDLSPENMLLLPGDALPVHCKGPQL